MINATNVATDTITDATKLKYVQIIADYAKELESYLQEHVSTTIDARLIIDTDPNDLSEIRNAVLFQLDDRAFVFFESKLKSIELINAICNMKNINDPQIRSTYQENIIDMLSYSVSDLYKFWGEENYEECFYYLGDAVAEHIRSNQF